mmetsp:Transcript_17764/g.29076  ORF Transcript_17764/g.29076 Transcript_17764/m.29076 type:complete len:251 (+) Transcript_17764:849-1601(+)
MFRLADVFMGENPCLQTLTIHEFCAQLYLQFRKWSFRVEGSAIKLILFDVNRSPIMTSFLAVHSIKIWVVQDHLLIPTTWQSDDAILPQHVRQFGRDLTACIMARFLPQSDNNHTRQQPKHIDEIYSLQKDAQFPALSKFRLVKFNLEVLAVCGIFHSLRHDTHTCQAECNIIQLLEKLKGQYIVEYVKDSTRLHQNQEHIEQKEITTENPNDTRADKFRIHQIRKLAIEVLLRNSPQQIQRGWNFLFHQ